MIQVLFLVIALLFLSPDSNAQQLQGEYNSWALFTAKEGGGKVCYITSNPTSKKGTYKVRGDVYLLVTYRGKGTIPEVSIDTGFPYKTGSEVDFAVDNKNFKFFTSPKTPQMAWAKDSQADRTAIDAMKRGARVTTKGTSQRGTYAQDTYSLKGFTAAYNKMMASCN